MKMSKQKCKDIKTQESLKYRVSGKRPVSVKRLSQYVLRELRSNGYFFAVA